MRLSAAFLVLALLGVLAGGWLAGAWLGLGLCLIADSVAVAAWALLRDDGKARAPELHAFEASGRTYETPTLHDVLERARRSG